jgi:hypothetical protein
MKDKTGRPVVHGAEKSNTYDLEKRSRYTPAGSILSLHLGALSEIKFIPKTSSSGAEGTVYYDSDDDHLYVATE